jgi:phage terminase large subunit-like protein
MPRINRKVRAVKQNRVTRAQILELLIGPNGASVFASPREAQELWKEQRPRLTAEFAARWFVARKPAELRPFAEIAHQYARDVVSGKVLACKWVRLACRRHLDNLETAFRDDSKYAFDLAKAERACRFIELLPHVKGGWAAKQQLLRLEPWQIFIVCSLFGWVHRDTGFRRFTICYILVSRKNGKSIFAAAIGLYMATCDGEFGSEVYSGATSEDQALEVFRPARQMMERSPELSKTLGLRTPPAVKQLLMPENGSRFEPVIGKPGDGASPHCGIVDEYHEHRSDALVDTIRTGMGARQQPLLLVITTAGDNPAGPCKLMQDEIAKILDGTLERDEVFGMIYTIDDPKKWATEEALVMANPNIGVSVFRDFLLMEQRAALANPRKQGTFLIKHGGVWVGAAANYFDVLRWNELADATLTLDEFIGYPCVIAYDLATKRDFNARVVMFRKQMKGKDHYYLFPDFYLPQAQMDRPENSHYREWQKHINVCPGQTVDFGAIEDETVAAVKQCHASEVAVDPWNAAQFGQNVAKRTEAEVALIDQNPKRMSTPMKELDVLIADGRVHHAGNPVMSWMIGNVMAREDANENVLPRKGEGREENKIDGAVAAIMALGRLMVLPADDQECPLMVIA